MRNTIGGVLLGIALLAQINALTGSRPYGVWVSPTGEWSAEVLYSRSWQVSGATAVSVRITCVAKKLIMRAKYLGVVDRPAAIDTPPGFVTIDRQRFTIGPGSLYGSEVEAFVFERPDCE